MIEETFAYGLVIGCSVFGILWGLVNVLLVSELRIFPKYFRSRSISLTTVFKNRSEKLIWKIIPILEGKMETMSKSHSLTTSMQNVHTRTLVPF
jgi:hypothetical protein